MHRQSYGTPPQEQLGNLLNRARTAVGERVGTLNKLIKDMGFNGYSNLRVQRNSFVPSADPSTILNWLLCHHKLLPALRLQASRTVFNTRASKVLLGTYPEDLVYFSVTREVN